MAEQWGEWGGKKEVKFQATVPFDGLNNWHTRDVAIDIKWHFTKAVRSSLRRGNEGRIQEGVLFNPQNLEPPTLVRCCISSVEKNIGKCGPNDLKMGVSDPFLKTRC